MPGELTHHSRNRPTIATGAIGVVISLFLFPPIFSRLFAMAPLYDNESMLLNCGAVILLVISWAFILLSKRAHPIVVALFFGVLLVIGIEITARFAVHNFMSMDTRDRLAWLANGTYPENMLIKGHPFLHYVGNTDSNNLGFPSERDFVRKKAEGTIRVACLGGSTTAGKWPGTLESVLNGQGAGRRFEVLDFGQNGYSSVHVLITFILSVLDHSPDYVILHTGWNDTTIRGKGSNVKTDFSNVFRTFEVPPIRDKWLIRTSVIYRHFHFALHQVPAWANIRNALDVVSDKVVTFDDLQELKPFRRNVEKIVDMAKARGIKVVVTTQPRSTDSSINLFIESKHLDQCNDVMREIHQEKPATLFVDLDAEITGHFDSEFFDLGHMSSAGHQMKAKSLAAVILDDLRGREP